MNAKYLVGLCAVVFFLASCTPPHAAEQISSVQVSPPPAELVVTSPERPDTSKLSKSDLDHWLSLYLDGAIYFPLARAQQQALQCGQGGEAAKIESRVLSAASKVYSTTDLVLAKFHGEQFRCCKLESGEWDLKPCDVDAATRALNDAEQLVVKLEAYTDEFAQRIQ